jgi:hypothetical protein
MDAKALFPYFFVGWAVFGTGGWWWVSSLTDPARKRKALHLFLITGGIIFGAFLALIMQSLKTLILLELFVAFVVYMNMRLMKVCNQCAALNRPQGLTSAAHCHKCGEALDA